MNAAVKHERPSALTISDDDLIVTLQSSLYPGAAINSIKMVIAYCRASGLDVMQKPVHIVPMWDSKAGAMRDVVMPGIGLYRTQASRSGRCAGVSEPEFGPTITKNIGGVEISYPEWCRVVAKVLLPGGHVAEFAAVERWVENYAIKGGKEKSIAPNAMWTRRPFGQLAKCAEAQAMRKAFPEVGSAPTADEMIGKTITDDDVVIDAETGEITSQSITEIHQTLVALREAAMNGTAALKAEFEKHGEDDHEFADIWKAHARSLRASASLAERGAQ